MDELRSAGILDPALRASYTECKRLNAVHGKTYYIATLLLPKSKRPFVHALYGFARYADEIVDDLSSKSTLAEKAATLQTWGDAILEALETGTSNDLVGRALIDTASRFGISHDYFRAFLNSMAMDLSVTSYETYENLMEYMYGSAVVIGLEMLPILGPQSPEAVESAKKLGIAFQLANFIRDVGEDLDRGRIYLPLNELAEHGVDREMLERRVLTPEIIEALKAQISRVRGLQEEAEIGIAFLSRQSRPCIQAASELYCGIVDEVEAINYDIFNHRAQVSPLRRTKVAAKAYLETVVLRLALP